MRDSPSPQPASAPRRPLRRRHLRSGVALGLSAALLGPLTAIALAGSHPPPASGGAAMGTPSTQPVGTTTLVATTPTTSSGTPTACSEPVVGTTTQPVPTAPGTTVTTSTSTTSSTGTGTTGGGGFANSAGGVATGTGSTPTTGGSGVTTTSTPAATTSTTATNTPSGSCVVPAPGTLSSPHSAALAKRGMWIWELPATDGGNVGRLITQAKAAGIGTLFIKSGDGNAIWSQFTPALVSRLHAAGLSVCAWQFVYGNAPVAEAKVGIQSVRDGADCLVIDAETQYQGRYLQAQQYLRALRAGIGAGYPVALAGFPYIDYHPTFPYSVFLGPGGAQFDLPQMYWQDIGTSVDAVYAHTFEFNELYQRPIDPLGQLYDAPPSTSVRRFRSVGLAYRAGGVSWWDWQSAGASQFAAIAAPAGPLRGFVADTTVASLARGAAGDLVVLAQEHLWNTHERVAIDGGYGPETARAIRAFQTQHGLVATGVLDPRTWARLLAVPLPSVTWVQRHGAVVATATTAASTPATKTTG